MTQRLTKDGSSLNVSSYKIIDLFAGIGGIRLGFQNIFKEKAEFVFSSEIDKHAKETYQLNFKELPHGDITKIDEKDIPSHDIILAGFPCQAFSVAGHRKGFEDTRGTLFFDVLRIVKYHKPKVVLLENVKGFVGHDKGNTFKVVKSSLEELGYYVHSKILNTKDFGIPQNRERIYIIAFLENVDFEFPQTIEDEQNIQTCLEDEISKKYYYEGKPLYSRIKDDVTNENSVYQWRRKYVRENKSNVCPTLTANMGTGGHNVPIIKDEKGIRKLTPRECGNFQGFPSNYKMPNFADSHLYKQFGNSVSINVIEKLAQNIMIAIEK